MVSIKLQKLGKKKPSGFLIFVIFLIFASSPIRAVDGELSQLNSGVAESVELIAKAYKVTAELDKMTMSSFRGFVIANVPISNSAPYEQILYFHNAASACNHLSIKNGAYMVRIDDPEKDETARLLDIDENQIAELPFSYEVTSDVLENDKDELYSCISMSTEPAAAGRQVILSTSKCQWIFPFSWRRLHTVIV